MTSINHLEEVRLFITPYIAQCGDYQQQDTCIPKMKKCQWHFDNGVKRSEEQNDNENK